MKQERFVPMSLFLHYSQIQKSRTKLIAHNEITEPLTSRSYITGLSGILSPYCSHQTGKESAELNTICFGSAL